MTPPNCGCKGSASTSCGCNSVYPKNMRFMFNGEPVLQGTMEVLGDCIGSSIIQDGTCGYKRVLDFPCTRITEDSIEVYNSTGVLASLDVSSLGTDVYVDGFSWSNQVLTLTDNSGNTPDLVIDFSEFVSQYTVNADGSITLDNGVDAPVTIPAECCLVSVELNGTNLEHTDSLGNTIVTDISALISDITDNGDGTYTHSANGVDTVIETANTSFILNGTDLELTDSNGTLTVDLSGFISSITANANGTFTHSAGGVDTVLPAQVVVDGATLSPTGVLTITQTNGAADVVVDLASLISEEGINTALTLVGTVLTVTDDAGAQSVDLAPLLATLADNVVNNVTLTGTVLTVSTSGGATFPIDFASIIPAQCCNNSAVLDASGNLTITQTNGPDVSVNLTPLLATLTDDVVTTVTFVNGVLTIATAEGQTFTSDLSDLEKCCNTGAVVGADNVLTITQDNGPDVTVDFTPILTADNISYDNTASGGPATNVQSAIDDLYAKICTDGFIVNAGTTALSADNSLGEETVECGDTLHFWSPDGTVDFNVTPGSAVVAADVNIPAIISTDAGNSAVVGTDGNIFVPAGAISTMTTNVDGSITHNDGNGNTTVIPAGAVSSLVANVDGSFTHDDGQGNTVTIPAPLPGAVSSFTQTVNADGTTNIEHDDGTGTTFDFNIFNGVNNDLLVAAGGIIQTGAPLVRDTITDSAGFIREFNGNVHFNIGDGHTNTGNNSLAVGLTNNITSRANIVGGRGNDVTSESNSVGGASNTISSAYNGVVGFNNESLRNGNSISGFNNIVDGDYGLVTGQANEITTGGEYKGLTGGRENIVNSKLSVVVGLENEITGGGRSMIGGEFNLLDVNYSVIGGANITATGGGLAVFGDNNTANSANTLISGVDNNDGGFARVGVIGFGLTAVRENQLHINHLYVEPTRRAFTTTAAGLAATLPGEVFFVGAAGTAQQMYRHG